MAVILLTAKDREEHVMLGRNAGATGYLIKPIRLGNILDAIKSCVMRPCTSIASRHYVGPERRRSRSAVAVACGIETLDDGSVIIPPDHLLAAKVRGDRAALRDAWLARADAIALVRRVSGAGATARAPMETAPAAAPT